MHAVETEYSEINFSDKYDTSYSTKNNKIGNVQSQPMNIVVKEEKEERERKQNSTRFQPCPLSPICFFPPSLCRSECSNSAMLSLL